MKDRGQDISPIDRVKSSRHPDRPYLLDYVSLLFSDFYELHGDRKFADDPAMICGFATFHNEPVIVIATIIGEGGSGGALGIAVADRVLMQENAYYSVISPENCSTIK